MLAVAVDTTYDRHSIVEQPDVHYTIPLGIKFNRRLIVDRHIGIDYILQSAALEKAVVVIENDQEEIGLLMRQKINLLNQVDNWKQIYQQDSIKYGALESINFIYKQENRKLRSQQNLWKSVGLAGVGSCTASVLTSDAQYIIASGLVTGGITYVYLQFIRPKNSGY